MNFESPSSSSLSPDRSDSSSSSSSSSSPNAGRRKRSHNNRAFLHSLRLWTSKQPEIPDLTSNPVALAKLRELHCWL